MVKKFKTDRINNGKVVLIKVSILLTFLLCIYIINSINPKLMESAIGTIGTIVMILILGFLFHLFENIFRKRINEISIDIDQNLLTINYYRVIEGNVEIKLKFENHR
jgi:hypothetical protein